VVNFTLRPIPHGHQSIIDWVGFKAGLDVYRKSNLGPSSQWPIRYTNYANPASTFKFILITSHSSSVIGLVGSFPSGIVASHFFFRYSITV